MTKMTCCSCSTNPVLTEANGYELEDEISELEEELERVEDNRLQTRTKAQRGRPAQAN